MLMTSRIAMSSPLPFHGVQAEPSPGPRCPSRESTPLDEDGASGGAYPGVRGPTTVPIGAATRPAPGRGPMLLTRDQIRQDKAVDTLTEAILERDQPRTTDLFVQMVRRQGKSVGDALAVVTEAEAPFVQVPSHINV